MELLVQIEVRRKDDILTLKFAKLFALWSNMSESETSNFSNPKVIYDEQKGRFVFVVLQQRTAPEISRVWLAVSKGETPDVVADWRLLGLFNSVLIINGTLTQADSFC
jgi:hypothetical protein